MGVCVWGGGVFITCSIHVWVCGGGDLLHVVSMYGGVGGGFITCSIHVCVCVWGGEEGRVDNSPVVSMTTPPASLTMTTPAAKSQICSPYS
jgi:hypothetical protein